MNKIMHYNPKNSSIILLIGALIFTTSVFGQYVYNPNYERIELNYPVCIYNASDDVPEITISRSTDIVQKMQNNDTPCSNFNVTYNGFESFPEAQAAFQFAVDIWSLSIESTVNINVIANFAPNTSNPNNLGFAGPTGVLAITPESGGETFLVPQALGEKLTGQDTNFPLPFESGDISATFNSLQPWYFGTDANPPANQFDFVTVVLHELGHGLGFLGLFNNADGTNGGVRANNGLAGIYSDFIENNNGDLILDETLFPEDSPQMFAQLTGNNLFSNSPLAISGNNNVLPKIYSPSTYAGGSSYSHWDENTFGSQDPNTLMTPFGGIGNATHDPGPSTIGFFEDMGWTICNSLSIEDFSLKSVEVSPNPFTSSIVIKLSSGLNDDYTIDLFDLKGRRVFSKMKTITNNCIILSNLDELDDALYFIKITNRDNGFNITKKIIKN